MEKEEITTRKAPNAIGPYSQAVKVGNLLFCSGQIAVGPQTDKIVGRNIKTQTKQVFENLRQVLLAAGCGFDDVVKVHVYLENMSDFPAMNEIYATYFRKPYPARATVQVSKLPKGVLVEIDCIAYIKSNPSHCGD